MRSLNRQKTIKPVKHSLVDLLRIKSCYLMTMIHFRRLNRNGSCSVLHYPIEAAQESSLSRSSFARRLVYSTRIHHNGCLLVFII
jgi:hypothetical protein